MKYTNNNYAPQTKFGRHIVFAPFLIIIILIILFLLLLSFFRQNLSDTFLGDYRTEINETSQEC